MKLFKSIRLFMMVIAIIVLFSLLNSCKMPFDFDKHMQENENADAMIGYGVIKNNADRFSFSMVTWQYYYYGERNGPYVYNHDKYLDKLKRTVEMSLTDGVPISHNYVSDGFILRINNKTYYVFYNCYDNNTIISDGLYQYVCDEDLLRCILEDHDNDVIYHMEQYKPVDYSNMSFYYNRYYVNPTSDPCFIKYEDNSTMNGHEITRKNVEDKSLHIFVNRYTECDVYYDQYSRYWMVELGHKNSDILDGCITVFLNEYGRVISIDYTFDQEAISEKPEWLLEIGN